VSFARVMQPLPRGVTGFDAPDEGVPVKRFTTACHAAARQVRGRVQQMRAAYGQVTPNFHEALVSLRGGSETVRVLCNAHHTIVAFTSPVAWEGDVRLRFVDCPELAGVLSGEFSILSTQEAGFGVASEMVAHLGEAELEQLRYWNPQRIGDVIFNCWD
jgi:hypothetical protein